jgi:hypothetical protein
VPELPAGRETRRAEAERVSVGVPARAPNLYRALRAFALGAFRFLAAELEHGVEVPFAFEEHGGPGRPALYEYRPLVRSHVEGRDWRVYALEDTAVALDELRREPAAAIFSRAHAGPGASDEEALFRSVLLPLLVDAAEACGGFDWDDAAFDRAYLALERSLFGSGHAYGAVAPLVGVSISTQVELGGGVRVRAAVSGELAAHWPEAAALAPQDFGREADRLCVLELERSLARGTIEPPDAPGELADAVTALRLATAAPIAAGPVLFERLDWRPFGVRPVLPIAATQPAGEPTRLDQFRGSLARDLYARLGAADDDPELGDALDRYELALFQAEPFRSEQLRESVSSLLGAGEGPWAAALRAAVLLGESARARAVLFDALRGLALGGVADGAGPDAVRRALVEVVMHGDRVALIHALDEALVGVRPRPAGYFASVATPEPRLSALAPTA